MAQQPPDYNKLLAQLKQAGAATSTFEAGFAAANGNVTKMNTLLADMEDKLDSISSSATSINNSFGDLTDILKQNLAEISKSNSALNTAKGSYRGIVSIAEKLSNEQKGIYDFNVKDLKKLQEKAKTSYENLKTSIGLLDTNEQLSVAGQALLEAQKQGYILERQTLRALEDRLRLERNVEKQLGATNALIQGSSKLLSELGFGHLSSELDDLNKKLRTELREEIERNGKAADSLATRFKYMGKGLAGSAKIFADGLSDPLFIVGKVLDTYFKINKASVDLQRLTGQNAVAAASWNTSYASAVDYLETAAELTKQTGMNAQNIFSEKVIAGAAELKVTMGLAADEAAGLAMVAQTSGRSVDSMVDSIVDTTSAFNKANRSAVSQGQVLRDVAKTSDSIKLSLGNNPAVIAKAASAARAMGMELSQIDRIAGSLTDFESSISNELEAQLLTGKDLNLSKARELALNNDLEGVAKELFKNSADINEFGKMNRIQQESYAKALGMSRDELAKMAYNQALANGMTEKQAAAAAKVNAEDMKRVAAQENFAKALEKIAGALAPILDLVGNILSMPLVPYLLLGAVAVSKIGGGLLGAVKNMGSLVKGSFDFVKNMSSNVLGKNLAGGQSVPGGAKAGAGGLVGKVKSFFSGGDTADKASEAGDKITGAADRTKNIKAGTGVKDFLTNLGKGIEALATSFKAIGPAGFAYLAGGLVLLTGAAIGIGYALNLATPAIEAFGKVVTAVFAGLAGLITAVADGFVKIMGAVTMENIGPMLLLGPALFGIAAGLAAIGFSSLAALPGIGALVLLGKVAPALATIGIGGETKSVQGEGAATEGGSMKAVEAKLQELINVTKQGMVLKVDGKVLATSNNSNGRLVAQQGK